MGGMLVVTPMMREPNGKARLYGRALQSVFNLEWDGQIDHYMANGGDDYSNGSGTVTRKYQEARDVFLAGSWEWLCCAEYDMIVPSDGLKRLAALDADIAYALYCFRHQSRKEWNAYTELTVTHGKSISKDANAARQAWGNVIPVAGVGQGFTLFQRHVIEAVPFRYWKGVSSDWAMAYDAQRVGLTQVCDTSVVCGHMTLTPSPQVLWPDVNEEKLYRTEFIG